MQCETTTRQARIDQSACSKTLILEQPQIIDKLKLETVPIAGGAVPIPSYSSAAPATSMTCEKLQTVSCIAFLANAIAFPGEVIPATFRKLSLRVRRHEL
eukprot:6414196-Amphidinium_carterae.1